MLFSRRLRDGVRTGSIRSSVRIWKRPRVRVGGRYPVDDGSIVVDAITRIAPGDISDDLAKRTGFDSVDDLLRTARHGTGENVYLIAFHYLPPGWDAEP